ncbi:hypothetical protein [Streptomyces sp. KR80]|uniref:hypothetical protein n=1 Tax=Streptomyces sp. KR80 TaxID=3457426 RepID=UPI003FD6ACAB
MTTPRRSPRERARRAALADAAVGIPSEPPLREPGSTHPDEEHAKGAWVLEERPGLPPASVRRLACADEANQESAQ